ncbi:MAG TPA: HD domain-containing phosphohydrolase [Myxococcota bacterium]|nr:HD domain-containing phosphohydrolase [Myxococcota bacterium]
MRPVHSPSEKPGVLLVDDEVNILKALVRLFRSEPVQVFTASSASEALARLAAEPIQVVISDQRMPGTSGVQLLAQIRELHPKVVRILLTGHAEIAVAVSAINHGEIFRLLTKPWNDDELRATVRQALADCAIRAEVVRLNALTQAQNASLHEMNHSLERKVAERTRELEVKNRELRTAYLSTVRALSEAVDAKDPYTRGHSERVGVYASRIARELGCKREFIERIYLAGLLHDIGKIGIPDAIIGKPEKLTQAEYELMKRHPEIGARILEPVKFLADIVPCVRHHHEWYDGSAMGYPERLSATEIPYPSRIILVADTVEAMTSDRPYRKALPIVRVIEEVTRFRGSQFDPQAADAFLRLAEREEEGFLETASKFDIEDFVSEPSESR